MNKVIFLDRDGTINYDYGYVYEVDRFQIIPGAIEGMKILQDMGYKLIIVTNQSGIARGYYSEQSFMKINCWMLKELERFGIKIAKVYYCPHLPKAENKQYAIECNCRKPKIGLFQKAIREFNIDTSNSYAIGDNIRDLSICKSTDVKGILLANSDQVRQQENELVQSYENIQICKNLEDAARYIQKKNVK